MLLLCCYTPATVRKAMTVSVLMRGVGENLGHCQADHFLAALRKQGSVAGEKLLKKTLLTLEIEGDSTGLGRFWVKRTNQRQVMASLSSSSRLSWMLPPRVTPPRLKYELVALCDV